MIKRIFLSVYFISKSFGFDPLRLLSTLRGLPCYLSDLIEDAAITEQGLANNFGCYYGCGIFELQKI